MNDFEKTRIDHVHLIERQMAALQAEVADLKPLATKWAPTAGSEMAIGGKEARVTLHFGGKSASAAINSEMLVRLSETDLTTAVIETLSKTLIEEQFRDIISAEVRRLQLTARTLDKAGKW